MKTYKKRIIYVLILFLIAGLLTGCGKKTLDPFDPKIFNVDKNEQGVIFIYDYDKEDFTLNIFDFETEDVVLFDEITIFDNYILSRIENKIDANDPRAHLSYEALTDNKYLFGGESITVRVSMPVEYEDKYQLKSTTTTITIPKIGNMWLKENIGISEEDTKRIRNIITESINKMPELTYNKIWSESRNFYSEDYENHFERFKTHNKMLIKKNLEYTDWDLFEPDMRISIDNNKLEVLALINGYLPDQEGNEEHFATHIYLIPYIDTDGNIQYYLRYFT